MTDDIKKRVEDLRARARAAISEEATDALNAAADTLEAEHKRAEIAERYAASMQSKNFTVEAERDAERDRANGEAHDARHLRSVRDALRTAIQGVLGARDMEWDLPPAARIRLSRAIDTKEKTDGQA